MTTFNREPRRFLPTIRFVIAVCFGLIISGCRPAEAPKAAQTDSKPAPPKPPAVSILEPEASVFPKYAGSKSCRECHEAQFAPWEKSNHGLAERAISPEMDRAAFEPGREFKHGTQTSTASVKDGRYVVETVGFDGKKEPYSVARVVGNDPLRQFVVERPGGRFQTLEVAFDPHKGEWLNVYGNEDRQSGEWGYWTGRGMNWNTMCASCHNTRLRKNYDASADVFRTSMAEMSVGCEACHGPMKAHVDWQRANPGVKSPDPTVKKLDRDQVFDTCGSCHARRRELTGDFVPGDRFSAHFQLTTVDESDLYFPDGTVRDELYEYGSFLSSKMHHAGVRCIDCHDPHRAKPMLVGNDLCQRCHGGGATAPGGTVRAPVVSPELHSFHKDPSVICQSCHMPVTVYMQRHPRHDHSFSIPDPLLTKENGTPNACNLCHKDKDVDWAIAAATTWWGPKLERPTRERARLVAAVRKGPQPAAPIVAMARSEPSPYWKAALLKLIAVSVPEADTGRVFLEYAQHADPLVRTAAVQALEGRLAAGDAAAQQVLVRKLEDPDRSVRVAAAWALRSSLTAGARAADELAHTLQLGADQPLGQLALGALALAQGRLEDAIRHHEKAVSWDARSAGIRHEYAVLLAEAGRFNESLAQIREAVKLEPGNPEFRYKLALALNETGGLPAAIPEFEQAVKLDPNHARAWYNLGLARNQLGNPKGAVGALLSAAKADPRDPRIPYALATIHAAQGRLNEARAAAEDALRIDPGMPEALRFLGR
ncbi:MAG: hypothetical protein RL088_3478 [Verrucomicrobiota bacterium]|jgi:Flp pilus assembly protein TadD